MPQRSSLEAKATKPARTEPEGMDQDKKKMLIAGSAAAVICIGVTVWLLNYFGVFEINQPPPPPTVLDVAPEEQRKEMLQRIENPPTEDATGKPRPVQGS